MKVAIVKINPPNNPYRTFAEIRETLCLAFRAIGHECVESEQFYLNRPKATSPCFGATQFGTIAATIRRRFIVSA